MLCFVSQLIIIKVKKVAISALKYNFLVQNRLKLRFLNVNSVKGRIALLKLANVYKTGGIVRNQVWANNRSSGDQHMVLHCGFHSYNLRGYQNCL